MELPFRILLSVMLPLILSVIGIMSYNSELPYRSGRHEFCMAQFFNVTCGPSQVLLMEHAEFGRMREGTCIKNSNVNLGCTSNVLPFMHSRCSGRRSCEVYIAEPALHQYNPCTADFVSYLEAEYSCIPVDAGKLPGQSQCHRSSSYVQDVDVTSEPGYISNESGNCRWNLRAKEGQLIKLSLLPFGTADSASRDDGCRQVGSYREENLRSSLPLCIPLRQKSASHEVIMSTHSMITITMLPPKEVQSGGAFLIKYEADGCPTLKAPKGGWVKIKGKSAEIHCNNSLDTYHLTCIGTEWTGLAGNCTEQENPWSHTGGNFDSSSDFPYGILIVVAIGVALGVFIGGLLLSLAAVYMKRKHRPYDDPAEIMPSMEAAYGTQLRAAPHEMGRPLVFKDSQNEHATFEDSSQNILCPKHDIIYGRQCSQHMPYTGTASLKSGHYYESPHLG